MPVANTLCDRVSGTGSTQRGYCRANLRGAWTALRLSGEGRGAQFGNSGSRGKEVINLVLSNTKNKSE